MIVLLGVAVLWAYWPSLGKASGRWWGDPRYAHGILVPAFALVLLWMRRDRISGMEPRPSAWGLLLIAAGMGLYFAGAYIYFEWLESISLIPTLAGLCVALGGWAALRWAWPAVAFLGFMVPLPHMVEVSLGWPLRTVATAASAYLLQTLGMPALREGHIIQLEGYQLGVVDACSGLSLLLLFFAFSTGLAMVIRRPILDRILIVASAVPIALVANVARIIITGLLHQFAGNETADAFFHDLAGWMMMPMALGLLWVVVWLLDHLFVEVSKDERHKVAMATSFARGAQGNVDRKRGGATSKGKTFPFGPPVPRL
jgi:exosortase